GADPEHLGDAALSGDADADTRFGGEGGSRRHYAEPVGRVGTARDTGERDRTGADRGYRRGEAIAARRPKRKDHEKDTAGEIRPNRGYRERGSIPDIRRGGIYQWRHAGRRRRTVANGN